MNKIKNNSGETLYFWENNSHGERSWGICVVTRMTAIYFVTKIAIIFIYFCKIFHSKKNKSYGSPDAGKFLHWPIYCKKCGCTYYIKTKNDETVKKPF